MAVRIKPKRRSGDNVAPIAGQLADGEMAINSTSRTIYLRVGSAVVPVANYFSGTMTGPLVIEDSNRPIKLISGTTYHGYIEWYVDTNQAVRSAFVGFGSSGSTTFTISNDRAGGAINLSTGAGGTALVNGKDIWNDNYNTPALTGHSTSWGTAPIAGYRVNMGTATAATWLLFGYSGNTFRYGIQGYDPGSQLRFYVGDNNARLNSAAQWNEESIPDLPASKIVSGQLHDNRLPDTMTGKTFTGDIVVTGFVYNRSGRYYGPTSGDTLIVGGNATGDVYIRPKGWSTASQTRFLNNGNIVSTGTITATDHINSSDERLKRDIKPKAARTRLADMLKLVEFFWKHNDEHAIGLIAQEVQKVAPEYVTEYETDEGSRLAVDKAAIAVECVIGLAERVAALEKQLESKND